MKNRRSNPRIGRRLLAPGPRAGRAASGAEAAPPPLQPPPLAPRAPAPSPGLSPQHQKLALYAGAALVVLIVLVILVLSPTRQPLELVPRGQILVQVVDVRRFLDSPVYQVLATASHPLLRALEAKEEKFRISLRRDVTAVVDTDDSTILLGRFQPDLMRDCFEQSIETREKEINRGRQVPVQLQIKQNAVDGYRYLYCDEEGVDHAFAAVGSSVVCFGDRWGVRRFLKGRAGVRGDALDDPPFAAAFSRSLARGAFYYRLEKPGGRIVASKLKDVLGEAGEGVEATFFAIAASRSSITLAIRFAARDAAAAAKLETQLTKASSQSALRPLLGADAALALTRSEATVTLESSIPLDGFDEVVERDKRGQGANLILTLLAS
ncbi:MAG TPA: hypothetical protein VNE39_09050 [Planctomycetota bacterium]|nr:hypothetical protein [Planctomycetota bacterium]